MKKRYIIIFVLCLLVFIMVVLFSKSNAYIYINWGIYLPVPFKEERIYEHNYREGDDFYIWFYSEESYDKLLKKDSFKEINENNINDLLEKMDFYYDRLDNTEKTLYWNNVSWNSLDLSELLKYKNYYYYKIKNGGDDILLLITNSENKSMYVFQSLY